MKVLLEEKTIVLNSVYSNPSDSSFNSLKNITIIDY